MYFKLKEKMTQSRLVGALTDHFFWIIQFITFYLIGALDDHLFWIT